MDNKNLDDNPGKPVTVTVTVKQGYIVESKVATAAKVKAQKIDVGGNFYVFDLYDSNDRVLAFNRYTYKSNTEELPFTPLSKLEEDILNPLIVEE